MKVIENKMRGGVWNEYDRMNNRNNALYFAWFIRRCSECDRFGKVESIEIRRLKHRKYSE